MTARTGETVVTRLAVNLLSLVPDDVGGAEEYAVRTLSAYARHGPANLRPVLYLSEAALGAYPGLGDAFDVEVHPNDGRWRARRVLAENTWLAARLAEAGRGRAATLTWAATAEATVDVYREVLGR